MRGTRPAFRLGNHLVYPTMNRMLIDGRTVQIEPRLMGILLCLADQADQVVSREDLLDKVWGATIVNEESVTRAIFQLRQILAFFPQQIALDPPDHVLDIPAPLSKILVRDARK